MVGQKNSKIKTFIDLHVWQEGHAVVIFVYKVTKNFPKEEIFGLTNQLRRAAVSITSNIAEGFSRQSYSEKIHFYSIAQGSLTEVQNQLHIAVDVGYLSKEIFSKLIEHTILVHKLLSGLIKKSKTIHNS